MTTTRGIRFGIAGALGTAAVFFLRQEYSLRGASDAFSITGLCFLIAALFLTAKHMHAYDLLIYSFHKFVNIWKNRGFSSRDSKGYHEFLAGRQYQKNAGAYYGTGGVLLLFALLLAFFEH